MYSKRKKTLHPCAIFASVLLITLAGCGGGSSGTVSGDNQRASKDSEAQDISRELDSIASDSRLFDQLFLGNSDSGFFQFDQTGIVRTYADPSHQDSLSEDIVPYAPTYTPDNQQYTVITSDYVDSFDANRLTISQFGTKVFKKMPDGLALGTQRIPKPLYRATINVLDLSGQNMHSAFPCMEDTDTPNNGAACQLAYGDELPEMPQGSAAYEVGLKTLVTHIVFRNSFRSDTSLEDIQASEGGTIEKLGKYRYNFNRNQAGWGPINVVSIEYEGAVYAGWLYEAGDDVRSGTPQAFNRIAADFIAKQLKANRATP